MNSVPQPLSKLVHPTDTKISIEPDCASKQPELAALVTQGTSIWALIEHTLGTALVNMLGAKPGPAMAMYGALSGSYAKTLALKAAAQVALNGRDYELFEALMRLYRSDEKQRHKFAHWIWAYCENVPKHLVLLDPAELLQSETDIAEFRHRSSLSGTFKLVWSERWLCYSKAELERIVRQFSDILNLFRQFRDLVGPTGHRTKEEIYSLLSQQPLVAAELTHLRQRSRISQ